mgnify:CR=1 FL=1
MAKYIYPAIFHPEDEGGFSIDFPDIDGCFTCGDNLAHGMEMASDVLPLMLVELEDTKSPIPQASSINDLELEGDDFATLIACDTAKYRRLLKNMSVKKTLTIPSWLNDSAVAAGINFSQVLQNALRVELGLPHPFSTNSYE